MKILVVSKHDFSNLLLNTFLEFSFKYNTHLFETGKFRKLRKYFFSNLNFILFEKKLKTFQPDFIFIVAPYFLSVEYFKILQSYKSAHSTAIVAGWIGDNFDSINLDNRFISSIIDVKFITDTGFKNYFSSTDTVYYLPLATTDKIFFNRNMQRDFLSSFVASHTQKREQYLSQINFPCYIYGTGWKQLSKKNQNNYLTLNNKKLSIQETAKLYNCSKIILNFNNENNIINGVNQRTFDPFLCGALVVHEYCKDLELNFDIENEIVIFKDIEELNNKLLFLTSQASNLSKIITKGEKNVLSNHLFKNRVHNIMRNI